MEQIRQLRSGIAYIVVMTLYCTVMQMTMFSSYHPILPDFLRNAYSLSEKTNLSISNVGFDSNISSSSLGANTNDSLDEDTISRDIGIIYGTGYVALTLGPLLAAFLIDKVELRITVIIPGALGIASAVTAYFSLGFWTIMASHFLASAGQIMTLVAFFTIFFRTTNDQKLVTRLSGLCSGATSIGYVMGYLGTGHLYQFLGFQTTYGIYGGLMVLDLIIRCCWLEKKEIREISVEEVVNPLQGISEKQEGLMETSGNDGSIKEKGKSSIKSWLKYLLDGHILLLTFQMVTVYMVSALYWTTAPNFAASHLKAEPWQIGTVMGLGSATDAILTFLYSFLMVTNRKRCIGMGLSIILAAAGFAWYPFVSSVWQTIGSEIVIRNFKSVSVVVIFTNYQYVTKCKMLNHKKEMGPTISSLSSGLGSLIGAYSAGLLVPMVTLHWLYIATAVALLFFLVTIVGFVNVENFSSSENTIELT